VELLLGESTTTPPAFEEKKSDIAAALADHPGWVSIPQQCHSSRIASSTSKLEHLVKLNPTLLEHGMLFCGQFRVFRTDVDLLESFFGCGK